MFIYIYIHLICKSYIYIHTHPTMNNCGTPKKLPVSTRTRVSSGSTAGCFLIFGPSALDCLQLHRAASRLVTTGSTVSYGVLGLLIRSRGSTPGWFLEGTPP